MTHVGESLKNIQTAIKILSLGIDYRKYSRFNYLAPRFHKTMDGEYRFFRSDFDDKIIFNNADIEFCINFVIESSLILMDFDYNINQD